MQQQLTANSKRIESIDILRGIIMVIMVLDHVRDYFHADSLRFSPEDFSQTTSYIFFTRWITHFCAPVFVFLAGTSAFLSGQRKTKRQLSMFLLTRGLWLIIVELIIVNFAWSFNFKLPFISLGVIWVIGISMIVLAAVIHLQFKLGLVLGLVLVFGHNLLDNIHFDGSLWSVLHEPKIFQIDETHYLRITYPLLPWIGIMILGYCFGRLYTRDFTTERRKRWLLIMGTGAIAMFIFVRLINIYGDPSP
ncbi:MAG TPA: heparan-alpha-glucosaminide N-acetyltransferase domain-containing protein, partial [Chitinophagaceae bacterium]|nr:heparan-alpha-glucosaminide N-acetyltransferase domain-containing protein [Chitinophagaceae bacterium]